MSDEVFRLRASAVCVCVYPDEHSARLGLQAFLRVSYPSIHTIFCSTLPGLGTAMRLAFRGVFDTLPTGVQVICEVDSRKKLSEMLAVLAVWLRGQASTRPVAAVIHTTFCPTEADVEGRHVDVYEVERGRFQVLPGGKHGE